MIHYQLTPEDCKAANDCGSERNSRSYARGNNSAHGLKADEENDLQINVYGAAAELAAAKVLGVEWPAHVDVFKTVPDLPPDWEVRRRSKWNYDCLVRKDDTGRVVHVVGSRRNYYVIGWISVDFAQTMTHHLRKYGGREEAWFIPVRELKPFGDSVWVQQKNVLGTRKIKCCDGTGVLVDSRIPDAWRLDCAKCGKFISFAPSVANSP